MTQPLIRVGQTSERKGTGRRVIVTAVNERLGRVELEPVGYGRHSHPSTATLRRDFRIIEAPPTPIGDWP